MGSTNDSSVVPPLLEMLDAPGVDITVQTEVAWALGRVPDRRSVKPLFDLDKSSKNRKDPPDPQIKKLKKRCSGPSNRSIRKTNTVRRGRPRSFISACATAPLVVWIEGIRVGWTGRP